MRYFTDEQIRKHLEESRRAQGLPLTITDLSVLDQIARILGPSKPRKQRPHADEPQATPPATPSRPIDPTKTTG